MSHTPTHDQRPAGGCTNCGGPVRTYKPGGWLCADCVADENRRTPRR
ncbi:hypothetical protein [Rhodococcus koreensis]